MSDLSERESRNAEAAEAFRLRLQKATVWIYGGEQGSLASGTGSATLLRSPAGNLVALTAKHIFESPGIDAHSVRLAAYRSRDGLHMPFAAERVEHPSADIALMLVPEDRVADSEAVPFDWSVTSPLPPVPQMPAGQAAPLWLVGFPEASAKHERIGPSRVRGIAVSLAYMFPRFALMNEPDGRLSFEWSKFTVPRREASSPKPEMPAPKPHGMSGGGLWGVRVQTDRSIVWEPSENVTLSGVQSAWDPNRSPAVLLVEPFERWSDWYLTALAELDAHAMRV